MLQSNASPRPPASEKPRLVAMPTQTPPSERIPHAPEAEEAVIGSLLLEPGAIARLAANLQPEHFFGAERAAIYRAMLHLYADLTPADLVTLRTELKAMGVLGEGEGQVRPSYLLKLMQQTPSPAHLRHYTEIVVKHWLARQIIAECSQTVRQAYGGEGASEPGAVLAGHSTRLQNLAAGLGQLDPTYFLAHEKTLDYPLRLEPDEPTSQDVWNKRPMLRFGLDAFDGRDWAEPPHLALLPSTLTTILGRTGGGKTLMALQIADANARAGLNVLYFHVELNQSQMLARRYTRLTGVSLMSQLLGRLGDSARSALLQASDEVGKWSGRVDFVHSPNWTSEKLVAELKARHFALIAAKGQGYDLVVLDYLQRLGRPDGGRLSEHEALAHNVRSFSDAANELNIAALMTSQVGRTPILSNQPEPPDLDDGLGSGDIERCSNQLLSIAISTDKTAVNYAIRKSTFGEHGRTGTLLYDTRRLELL